MDGQLLPKAYSEKSVVHVDPVQVPARFRAAPLNPARVGYRTAVRPITAIASHSRQRSLDCKTQRTVPPRGLCLHQAGIFISSLFPQMINGFIEYAEVHALGGKLDSWESTR